MPFLEAAERWRQGAGMPTPSSQNTDVGRNIRRLRDAHGLTQEQLAERAGLTPEAVSMIETGKRRGKVETLQIISKALGEPLAEIFKANQMPIPQALSEFLETSLAKDVTDEEVTQLQELAVSGRRMTVESYYLALKLIRSTEPTT